ncbi:MAG: CocE/NonD family hydrolase [Verrucomicrobiales bacterium]
MHALTPYFSVLALLSSLAGAPIQPQWALPSQTPSDQALRSLLEAKVTAIEQASLDHTIATRADWEGARDRMRSELKEMLGLHPEPARTDLHPVVTSTFEGDGYVVENLHFQPMPRLYLAANLYRPTSVAGKLPAILYVCGHSNVQENGVSLGNKTAYHHHGVWFARHGYVCLVIDTVQWGELVGHHHGTYRLGRWWWASRGFTPAGVEAWNGIRALDYLESRPEVDRDRLGMTGRSGGGAYTWWVAAIDERVKAAAPTAGIASMRNHVIDGCIEGHCDCMFMHNMYQWDFDRVAALVAPRPLLILNTDKDDIFPLDGVYSVYRSTRRIYDLLGAADHLGLQIAEGPHEDTQSLNVGAFAWFERFLKGADRMATFDEAAKPSIPPARLRVFAEPPKDERTTRIDDDFVPTPPVPAVPATAAEWLALRESWMAALHERVFRLGPGDAHPATPEVVGVVAETLGGGPHHASVALKPATQPPWTGDERKQTQLRRRFLLLGTSIEREQVASIRRLIRDHTLASPGRPLHLRADGDLAALALYAAVLEPGVARLDLYNLPESHALSPCLPSVLRYLDLPQTLALAAEKCHVTVHRARPAAWSFATETARSLGWKSLELQPAAEVIDVRRITNTPAYCAFTDLVRHRGTWFCVFREGDGHVPGADGTIRVLSSTDGMAWEPVAQLSEAGVDLRDPKISVTPEGRLMLLIGGSVYDGQNGDLSRSFVSARGRVSFSDDGRTWSPPTAISVTDEWLWRVTWQDNTAYGVSYQNRGSSGAALNLWKSRDALAYDKITSLQPGGDAWPNETTLRFDHTGSLLALVRRERDNRHAWLGRSPPPFVDWSWHDTGRMIQGPNFIRAANAWWYAGRDQPPGDTAIRTVVGLLHHDTARPIITLPSGGDTSYPGLVEANPGELWVSYYSSHEGPAAIYLARLRLAPAP